VVEKTKYFYKKIYLVAEVVIGIDGPDELVSDDELKVALDSNLNQSTDGRQLFSVETFKEGLGNVVEGALRRAVDANASRRFPNRITLDGTSFSCKLSDHKMKKLASLHVSHSVEVLALKATE
jgi:hypothetical protein